MYKGYLRLKNNPYLLFKIQIKDIEDIQLTETKAFIIITLYDKEDKNRFLIVPKDEIQSIEVEEE